MPCRDAGRRGNRSSAPWQEAAVAGVAWYGGIKRAAPYRPWPRAPPPGLLLGATCARFVGCPAIPEPIGTRVLDYSGSAPAARRAAPQCGPCPPTPVGRPIAWRETPWQTVAVPSRSRLPRPSSRSPSLLGRLTHGMPHTPCKPCDVVASTLSVGDQSLSPGRWHGAHIPGGNPVRCYDERRDGT